MQPIAAVAWPSGLRRWFKAPVSSGARVRISPLPTTFVFSINFALLVDYLFFNLLVLSLSTWIISTRVATGTNVFGEGGRAYWNSLPQVSGSFEPPIKEDWTTWFWVELWEKEEITRLGGETFGWVKRRIWKYAFIIVSSPDGCFNFNAPFFDA